MCTSPRRLHLCSRISSRPSLVSVVAKCAWTGRCSRRCSCTTSRGDAVSKIYGAMSFGYLDASKTNHVFTRKLEVENRSFLPMVYAIKATQRYQDDADTGAMEISVSPSSIVVMPFSSTKVTVKLSVDGSKLRNNLIEFGSGWQCHRSVDGQ